MISEIFAVFFLVSLSGAFSAPPGQPLFLSQYLPNNPGLAKKLSQVQGNLFSQSFLCSLLAVPGYSFPSYSGYLTVNQSAGSNTFFWFFPAEAMAQTAPILLWLQGGMFRSHVS